MSTINRTNVSGREVSPSTGTEQAQIRKRVIGFFVLLFLIDCYLYFWNIGHFFQADSLFLLHYRVTSLVGALREFIQLHPSGWYRPLAFEFIPSVLYPFVELSPPLYRIPVYALFFADTIAVYLLVQAITGQRLTAGIAAFFFNIHTTNAYTSYDFGFTPELMYTLFYIGSVMAYLRYIRQGAKSALYASLALFVASLLSKEGAVTLPGVLVALQFVFGSPRVEGRASSALISRALRPLWAVRWHIVIMAAYVLYVVGHLHVMNVSFSSILEPAPAVSEPGSYHYTLGKANLQNADIALTWAFNIPRGWNTDYRHLAPALVTALKVFRAFILVVLAIMLFTRERKFIFMGAAWFFITLIPSLPLVNHFLPYYLFLPVVGFSLLIGAALAFVVRQLHRAPVLAFGLPAMILAGMLYVCAVSIHADVRTHRLLGGSANLAINSLNDIKRLYPVLPPGAIIYIIDDQEPLSWDQDHGALVQMAYGRNDISVLYSDEVKQFPPEIAAERVIVLRYDNGTLVDETKLFQQTPQLITYKDGDEHNLRLSPGEVKAGDSFALEISGLRNAPIQITYSRDGGPVETFRAKLDNNGIATFNVTGNTTRGFYRFLGFSLVDEQKPPDWYRSNAVITVH